MIHKKCVGIVCLAVFFYLGLSPEAWTSELRHVSFVYYSPAAIWKEDPAHVICDGCGDLKALSHIPTNYAERVIKIRTPFSGSVQFSDDVPAELKDLKERTQEKIDSKPMPSEIIRETVFFDFDSAVLKAEELERLRKIIIPGAKYELFGNTCAAGDEGYNDRLALRRSQSVYLGLMSLGVGAQHIKMGGKGRCCYADNDERSGKNRRVEIILHKEGR